MNLAAVNHSKSDYRLFSSIALHATRLRLINMIEDINLNLSCGCEPKTKMLHANFLDKAHEIAWKSVI